MLGWVRIQVVVLRGEGCARGGGAAMVFFLSSRM